MQGTNPQSRNLHPVSRILYPEATSIRISFAMTDSRSHTCWAVFLLITLSLLPYLFHMDGPFVYDDHGQIAENWFLQNPGNLMRLITLDTLNESHIVNGRRPLVVASYFMDRFIWGNNPAGYRVTNLLFHAGTVLLLYFFLTQLPRRYSPMSTHPYFAFTGTLLFGLHPVLAEAVYIPSFRPDIFFSFFVLLFLTCALPLSAAGSFRRRAGLFAGGMMAFACALASKETGVIAPVLLAGIWWIFPALRPARKWMLSFGTGCAVIVIGFIALSVGGELQAVTGHPTGHALPFPAALYTMPWLWLRYLILLFWPYPLVIDRIIDPATVPRILLGGTALIASLLLILMMRKRSPWTALGLGWMFISFLPASNLVPLFNPMADRYAYCMVIGFSMLLAHLLISLYLVSESKFPYPLFCLRHYLKHPGGKSIFVIGVGAIALLYLVLNVIHLRDFKSDYILWNRTLEHEPRSDRAHLWVGLELKRQNKPDEALSHFEAALLRNPYNVGAYINRGILHGERGALQEAEKDLRKAIEIRPMKSDAHWNLCVLLNLQGKTNEMRAALEDTLRLNPRHRKALRAHMQRFIGEQKIPEALALAERMLEIEPNDPEALAARSLLRRAVRRDYR